MYLYNELVVVLRLSIKAQAGGADGSRRPANLEEWWGVENREDKVFVELATEYVDHSHCQRFCRVFQDRTVVERPLEDQTWVWTALPLDVYMTGKIIICLSYYKLKPMLLKFVADIIMKKTTINILQTALHPHN